MGRVLDMLTVPSFVVFRLLPHALMLMFVYDAWDSLSAPVYDLVVGFGGLLYLNAVNVHLLLTMLKPAREY